jgi:GTP-binding protein Era
MEFNRAVDESDVLLLVVNLDAPKWRAIESFIQYAIETKKPLIAAITKSDLPEMDREMKARERLAELNIPTVAVSARKSPKLARELILDLILEKLDEGGEPQFASDMYTTQSAREIVEETVREKCFEYLHQEIPYGLATKVMKYDETSGRKPEIHCDIVVERESHVKIVIGRGGENLGRIGTLARQELEVILKTHVRCVNNWTEKSQCLSEFGYASPS